MKSAFLFSSIWELKSSFRQEFFLITFLFYFKYFTSLIFFFFQISYPWLEVILSDAVGSAADNLMYREPSDQSIAHSTRVSCVEVYIQRVPSQRLQ